jgi:hypothetical protein
LQVGWASVEDVASQGRLVIFAKDNISMEATCRHEAPEFADMQSDDVFAGMQIYGSGQPGVGSSGILELEMGDKRLAA